MDDDNICKIADLAQKADNLLCATRLPVPDSLHVEGLKGGLLEMRNALAALYEDAVCDTSFEWHFGYPESAGGL